MYPLLTPLCSLRAALLVGGSLEGSPLAKWGSPLAKWGSPLAKSSSKLS